MNRRDFVGRLPLLAGTVCLGLLGLVGCSHQQTRLQSAEETERERYGVKTVGDVCIVGNADPTPVVGVGLVQGLEGTGGDCPPCDYRTRLESQLQKEGVRDVKSVLADPTNAIVVVTGQIPPGANKGDPIDLQLTLPKGSRTTSLRGGYLRRCSLFNYASIRSLTPNHSGPDLSLPGHAIVKAEGPVLVGFGDGDEDGRDKRGRIWNGGRCLAPTPFTLQMNPDKRLAFVADLAAQRVNDRFRAASSDLAGDGTAKARDNVAVLLRVPPQYRFNVPHFLRVVRLIPLNDAADAPANSAEGTDPRPYRQRLAEDLLDPARTVTAALRLEALGERSIPALKAGLGNNHELVRFCSAEALAYLGSAGGTEELARAARVQPLFQAFALTALASLDENAAKNKLAELLASATDDATRYGAFRALRASLEKNDDEDRFAVGGQLLNDSFWLHKVAPNTEPLVHVCSARRAEVVLFGKGAELVPEVSLMAGEFIITAGVDDRQCWVSRIPLQGRKARRQCSLQLEEVLRTIADLGGTYPEVLELLQQARRTQCLNCPVRCDALPPAATVYDLVNLGKGKAARDGEGADIPGGQDIGSMTTLFPAVAPARLAGGLPEAARPPERGPRGRNENVVPAGAGEN
jgi:hypothetical protein